MIEILAKDRKRVKLFMQERHTAITPEIIIKFILRGWTVEQAEILLDDMVSRNDKIVKIRLEDDSYAYYYKYTVKKRYY